MAAELLLNPGYEKNGLFLLRGPVLSGTPDTLLTTANMNRSLKQLKPGTALAQYVDVGAWDRVRIMVFGQGATNLISTATLYGWKDFLSPASLIGQVTCTLSDTASQDSADAAPGWHTDPELEAKLRAAMAPEEDWFACDTYDIVLNPGGTGIAVTSSGVAPALPAEYLAWFEASLINTQYQFMALMFTVGGTPMTKMVAAYSPVSGKVGRGRIGN